MGMVKIQEYDMNACAKQKIGEHRNFANLGVWFTGTGILINMLKSKPRENV